MILFSERQEAVPSSGAILYKIVLASKVLAIKNRMREVQARKASARATKASAVVD